MGSLSALDRTPASVLAAPSPASPLGLPSSWPAGVPLVLGLCCCPAACLLVLWALGAAASVRPRVYSARTLGPPWPGREGQRARVASARVAQGSDLDLFRVRLPQKGLPFLPLPARDGRGPRRSSL